MLILRNSASVATIIRIPYSSAYSSQLDLSCESKARPSRSSSAINQSILDHIAYVILWTVVECGLGLIAGSLPMLRKLLRSIVGSSNRPKYYRDGDETQLVTIGRARNRKGPAQGISAYSVHVRAEGDSDILGDDESTQRIVETPTKRRLSRDDGVGGL